MASTQPNEAIVTPHRADTLLRAALADAFKRLAMRGWIDRPVVLGIVEAGRLWLKAHG